MKTFKNLLLWFDSSSQFFFIIVIILLIHMVSWTRMARMQQTLAF